MSPIIPIEQIVAWGDNLTSGGYISTVVSSLNSGGSSRTGLNHGIPAETSAQILNRIYGYSFLNPGGDYGASAITLRARRTQPPSLIDSAQLNNWTDYGLRIAEPRSVNFYVNGTLIGTSYTRLSADSTITSGNPTIAATGHPFVDGDIVHFLTDNSVTGATASGTNIFRGKHYFVRDKTTDSYKISETSGGAAITFDEAGTVTALGDFTLPWTPGSTGPYSAITTRTYTDKDTSTAVLWMGANDITADPSCVATVQSNIRSAVSHFKTLDKRVVILTPIIAIGSGAVTGTEAAVPYLSNSAIVANRNTIGTWILNTYPNNSIDIWKVLRDNATADSGDVTDVSNGGTPRSLRTNEINLNPDGNNIVAARVYNLLNTNKW
jgi:lysophospholipase L1-like esterase